MLSDTFMRSDTPQVHHPPSSEEDDLLNRSSKKIKNVDGKSYEELWPKLGVEAPKMWTSGQSFAEKLKGINGQDSSSNRKDDMSDDSISEEADGDDNEPLCIIKEDPHRNFPTFTFSEKLKKRLYKPWRQAVIVKLLGKTIGYKLLLAILQPLWAKRGIINLINIGHGFFVVKLSNKEDYENALTGGPWLIFDHYLTVRPWEPSFNPVKATVNKQGAVSDSGTPEVWKVVKRHRRQKKGTKEEHQGVTRQGVGGSRFGVLVEEGDKGTSDNTKSFAFTVQKDVEAKQVLQQVYGNLDGWEKKGGGKKKLTKSAIVAGGSKNQVEERGKNEMGVSGSGVQNVGSQNLEIVKAVDFNSNPFDPGDPKHLSSLQGKFWIGPSNSDQDHVMPYEDESNGPNGSVVPETQANIGS
ncbi:hypothetical protein K1719_036094 [Acacia pycnantha]|nr:hypothetical protein K1719_036094 [Acacia pycnantha]